MLILFICLLISLLKDNHKENAASNKTQSLTKIMNMSIWLVGTLNQLFIRGSYTSAPAMDFKVGEGGGLKK